MRAAVTGAGRVRWRPAREQQGDADRVERRGVGLRAQIGARAGLERAWRRGVMWARGGDVAASRWLRALLERRLATSSAPSGRDEVVGSRI